MDSEAAANSSLVSESKENGGDSLPHLGPPAAGASEENFETASEDSGEEKEAVAVEESGNPNAVLSEKPYPVEGSDGKIEETVVISNQETLNSHGKDEVLDSSVEVEGDLRAEGSMAKAVEIEEKDEGLDGNEEFEVAEEEVELQPEMEQSSVVVEGGKEEELKLEAEQNDPALAVSSQEPSVDEQEKDVAVDIVSSEAVKDSKHVDIELNADDAEKVDNVAESKNDEEEGADAVGDEKQTENVVVALLDSDPVVEETGAVKAEENGAADSLQAGQDLNEALKSKAEEGESAAIVFEENVVPNSPMDSKPAAEETIIAKAGENEDADGIQANEDLSEALKSKAEEGESAAVVFEENDIPNSSRADQGLDEAVELKSADEDVTTTSVTKKNDQGTEGERALIGADHILTDLDAKPSNDGEDLNPSHIVEPVPSLSDDSDSKKAETEPFEKSDLMENGTSREISVEDMLPGSVAVEELEPTADDYNAEDDEENLVTEEMEEEEEEDGNISDKQPWVAILDSSETAKQIMKEMEEGSSGTSFESSRSYQHPVEGQIISDSDEVDTDEDGDGKELFDAAALAALLKAASGASSDGSITVTSQDGTRVFSMDRPAGLGSSAPALRPASSRPTRPTFFSPSDLAVTAEPENEMDEEEKKLHEKVEDIRVKFLRLVMRLGHTPEDTVASQVLYRLNLAEGLRRGGQMSRAFSIESAKKKAIQLEAEGEQDLEFSCNILVIGKTGVGKSATINSIFGEEKSTTNAFQAATSSVREISGVVDGVKIRVVDTPGLRSSVMEQATNRKILSSIKKYTKKCPPDIVLYVDRLDTQTRDFNDLPLLKSITSALGSSIWFNAIVALTHAASAPPEGPNGSSLSYEVFIAQRSHVVQHSIRQAAGDMRLMNPVALVENHPSCRRNREGERVLPNGLSWRPQLLLLCYSSKILSEANSLLKLQDPSPGKLFGFRYRSPPLPYLLSTLLQSRPHPKLPTDQSGDNADSDIDLDDFSDADEEEEDEYDQLPSFKPLKKSQIAKLTKEQRKAYFDEYDYRFKLLQKKQFKEEVRRLKEMKKRGKSAKDDSPYGEFGEDFDQDAAPAAVPVPLPDMALPPSFDSDVPTYRYRFLEPTSQLLTRPVLDTHGWDHDCGYDGVSIEESLAIASRFPAAIAVQITKDKKDFSIHLDSSVAAKYGETGSTLAGFDIQSVGKQLAYILRGETKFKKLKKNKTAAGVSVTFLGETVATGLKVEDQLTIGKRVGLVASTGVVRAQGDVAYGANLEARLREKDYPIGQALSTLGLSLMKWRGDLALGANLQSQMNVGRDSKVAVRVGLNNKLSGQITVRTSSSEHLQIALVGILPLALSIYRSICPGEDMAN